MRALIIDDERLARTELRRLLAAHPEIEIAGEAANAEEARRAIADLEPDLLFLDVQMPGETGFDLLASLPAVPLVVFTTAYDEFALRAFEVSALDYLLKPIEPDRLARTVERLAGTRAADAAAARPAPGGDSGFLSLHDRIFVKDGDRCWLVEAGDIRLLESEGNYVRVFFGAQRPLVNRSLNQLEARLDPRVFFRANRRQIINVKTIEAIGSGFGGRLIAKLAGGHEVALSRRRSRAFQDRLGV